MDAMLMNALSGVVDPAVLQIASLAITTDVDYRKINPNLQLVNRFYHNRCARLYDGYRVPTAHPNGTLASHTLIGTTFPILFGYSEYYELYDEIDVQDETTGMPRRHNVVIWCGELYNAFESSARWSGADVTFMVPPRDAISGLKYISDPRIAVTWLFMINAFFKISPILKPGPFVMNTENGNILTRNIHVRREFAFLESFTPASWSSIAVTLVVLSFLISRLVLVVNNSGKVALKRFSLIRWFIVALDMVAVMVANSAPNLERLYRRSLLWLWYAACILFCGCLSGSLRDLMSKANVVIKPQDWADLFYCTYYDNLTLVIFPEFPYYKALTSQYAAEIELRQTRGKLFVSADNGDFLTNGARLWNDILQYLNMMIHFEDYLLVADKFVVFIVFWVSKVCHETMTLLLSYVFDFLNSNPHLVGRDKDGYSPFPSGHEAASSELRRITDEFRKHVTMSAGSGTMHSYVPIHRLCPQQVQHYIHRFMTRFRDVGFIKILDDRNGAALLEQFTSYSQESSWAENAAGWEVVTMLDFYGPLIIFGCLVDLDWVCIAWELKNVSAAAMKRMKTRIKIRSEARKKGKGRKKPISRGWQVAASQPHVGQVGKVSVAAAANSTAPELWTHRSVSMVTKSKNIK